MQMLAWIFTCDHKKCPATLITPYENEVDAYINLSSSGWQAHRAPASAVRRIVHYCPEHTPAATAKAVREDLNRATDHS